MRHAQAEGLAGHDPSWPAHMPRAGPAGSLAPHSNPAAPAPAMPITEPCPSRNGCRGVSCRARRDHHRAGHRGGSARVAGVARIARIDRHHRRADHRRRNRRGGLKHRPAEQPVAQPASPCPNQQANRNQSNRHFPHVRSLRRKASHQWLRGVPWTRQLYITLAEVQMQHEAVLQPRCGSWETVAGRNEVDGFAGRSAGILPLS